MSNLEKLNNIDLLSLLTAPSQSEGWLRQMILNPKVGEKFKKELANFIEDGSGLSAELQYNLKVLISSFAPELDIPNNIWALENMNLPASFSLLERVICGFMSIHHFGIVGQGLYEHVSREISGVDLSNNMDTSIVDGGFEDTDSILYQELLNQERNVSDIVLSILRAEMKKRDGNLRLMDLGCGSGFVGFDLAGISDMSNYMDIRGVAPGAIERTQSESSGLNYMGVAISELQVMIANLATTELKRGSELQFIHADMNSINSFPEMEQDAFLQLETSMYIRPDVLGDFFSYVYANLASDGLYVGVPWLKFGDNEYANKIDAHYSSGMHDIDEYKKAIKEAGFNEVTFVDLTDYTIRYWQVRRELGRRQNMERGGTDGMGLDTVENPFIKMYGGHPDIERSGGYYLVIARKTDG